VTTRLPTPDDGVSGLLGLADLPAVTPADVYRFLGFIRDNKNGAQVVLEARQILAARMVNAQRETNPETDARVRVAEQIGSPPKQHHHFYDLVKEGNRMHGDRRASTTWRDDPLTGRSLPTAADGVDGLLAMLPTFGLTPEQLFRFLGWLRHSTGATLVGKARRILAARLVLDRIQQHPGEDVETAQKAVAKELGYPTHHRPNFYKRVQDGLTALNERSDA
jgi:hypothetical protein